MASKESESIEFPPRDASALSNGFVEGYGMNSWKISLRKRQILTRKRNVLYTMLTCILAIATLELGSPFAKPSGALPYRSKIKSSEPPASSESTDPAAPPKLDSVRVHKLYLDGDFDVAIPLLEDNLKETRQYRHDDSVFIFKHLGVMYAAQYETREKGKYFMHRLLMVEPTAKIMDMYASDMIYMIFKNIQEEFEQNRAQLTLHSVGGRDPKADTTRPQNSEIKKGSSRGKAWILAGTALATVAVGVGTYYLLTDNPKTTVRNHNVEP